MKIEKTTFAQAVRAWVAQMEKIRGQRGSKKLRAAGIDLPLGSLADSHDSAHVWYGRNGAGNVICNVIDQDVFGLIFKEAA
jgi:hypothetical protein